MLFPCIFISTTCVLHTVHATSLATDLKPTLYNTLVLVSTVTGVVGGGDAEEPDNSKKIGLLCLYGPQVKG